MNTPSRINPPSAVSTLAIILFAATMPACGVAQPGADEVAEETELNQTQSDALLSKSEAVGVYEGVSAITTPTGVVYHHDTVALMADGKFRVEVIVSDSRAAATGRSRIATGTWGIPFLRFNQVKLTQDSNEAWGAAFGFPGLTLAAGERFKPRDGVLYNARAQGEGLARFCLDGCVKAAR